MDFLTIYFVGVTVTWLIEVYAIGRQVNVLKDAEKTKEKFKNLDGDIKDCYNEAKLLDSMEFQYKIKNLAYFKVFFMLIFDVAFIHYQGPLIIWNMILN